MAIISSVYGSRFVKSHELSYETRVPAVIDSITEEVFGNESVAKLVIKVTNGNGWARKLALNQNNAQRLADALGDDTDDWPGADVELWVEDVDFRGQTVASVKIGPAPLTATTKRDDEIPF